VIHILTGPVHSGKTTLLKDILFPLKEQDLSIDGYLSEAIRKHGDTQGYDLYDLKEHRYYPFIRKKGRKDWQSIGPFFFLPETLDLAKRIIYRSEKAHLCVVDEVGPLELDGKGVWPAIAEVFRMFQMDFLFVVRDVILENFLARMERDDTGVYSIEQKNIQSALSGSIVSNLKKRRNST
jgi:nucleoside-triphosphatase THEP1